MGWTPLHAAHRYFRRKGASVNPANKMVIFNHTIKNADADAYQKHIDTLNKKKYDFSNSLFFNAD